MVTVAKGLQIGQSVGAALREWRDMVALERVRRRTLLALVAVAGEGGFALGGIGALAGGAVALAAAKAL